MENKIKVYFGGDLANLYEVGYLSVDLFQLITFSDLIEQGDIDKAKDYFGEKPKPINRYSSLYRKRKTTSEIADVKKGSLELIIAGVTLSAAIIMPLVQIAAQKYFDYRNANVQFQISPDDLSLKRIIDAYAKGDFGRGQEGLDTLFAILERRDYDVRILAENTYIIEHVIDKYSKRIVKTVNKNR